jgi:hypothetical protein
MIFAKIVENQTPIGLREKSYSNFLLSEKKQLFKLESIQHSQIQWQILLNY